MSRQEELLRSISLWLLKGGTLGAVLGIGYLLWGGFQGYFASPINPTHIATVVSTLNFFLYCCGWALALGLIGSVWSWRLIGLTMFLVSSALWLFLPFLFVAVVGVQNPLTQRGIEALRSLLVPPLLVGFAQAAWAGIEYWRRGPTLRLRARKGAHLIFQLKMLKQKTSHRRRRLTPFSPCWQLPVVGSVMCEHCPVKQRRRPCWRLKQGCQCSPALIDALLANLEEKEKESPSILVTGSVMVWQKGQKPPCHRCAIYLLHQQVKYDWLAPFFFFLPPVLIALYWDIYKALYGKAAAFLNDLWFHLAFVPPTSPDPLKLNEPIMVGFIAFVLCAFLMVYAIQLIEFFLFKLYL